MLLLCFDTKCSLGLILRNNFFSHPNKLLRLFYMFINRINDNCFSFLFSFFFIAYDVSMFDLACIFFLINDRPLTKRICLLHRQVNIIVVIMQRNKERICRKQTFFYQNKMEFSSLFLTLTFTQKRKLRYYFFVKIRSLIFK
jgi:hypothetical protein